MKYLFSAIFFIFACGLMFGIITPSLTQLDIQNSFSTIINQIISTFSDFNNLGLLALKYFRSLVAGIVNAGVSIFLWLDRAIDFVGNWLASVFS